MAKFVESGGMRLWEHDIRASAGVAMAAAQGAEEAQKLLGHTDLRTTQACTGARR
jgi:integrase